MKRITVVKMAIASAMIFGQIGISQAGTCTPPCVVEGPGPEIRLLNTDADQDWEIEANQGGFEIDQNGGGSPAFKIEPSAGDDQLVLDDNKNIGINTDAPQSSNEVEVAGNTGSTDTFAAIAISPGGPGDDSGRISVNDFTDTLSIGVRTGGGGYNNPVAIDLDAGNNKLTIDSAGRVGLGPTIQNINSAATLHVEGSGGISGNLFLDSTGAFDDWLLDPGNSGLWFRNGAATNSPAPVKFGNGAPANSLVIEDATGDLGVGTPSPVVDLHVLGEGGGSVEQILRLQSSVPPQMTFLNSASSGTGLWYFAMTADDQFKVSYDGTGKVEAKFFQNGNVAIAGTLAQNSDRDSKTGIVEVDNKTVLDAVLGMPVSTWEYKADKGVKHLGPMAQDFHAAFGLGTSPKSISSIDTGGVALAAIKGLNEIVQSKDQEIQSLKERLTMLENLVNKLTAKEVVMNQIALH